jgi:hypothetical protein
VQFVWNASWHVCFAAGMLDTLTRSLGSTTAYDAGVGGPVYTQCGRAKHVQHHFLNGLRSFQLPFTPRYLLLLQLGCHVIRIYVSLFKYGKPAQSL